MAMKLTEIDPKQTAVIVIDMQNDFVRPGAPLFVKSGYELSGKLAEFLDRCREEGIQIFYTEDTVREDFKDAGTAPEFCDPIKNHQALLAGTEGAKTFAPLTPKDGDVLIIKHRYSAFFGTELDMILRTMGIETVLITGVCTDCCVFSTARDAGFYNYKVGVLSDLTGTMDVPDNGFGTVTGEELHRVMMIMMAHTTCHCLSSEEFFSIPRTEK